VRFAPLPVGEVFGGLKILEIMSQKNKHGARMYRVLCLACDGESVRASNTSLRQGRQKSCGCAKHGRPASRVEARPERPQADEIPRRSRANDAFRTPGRLSLIEARHFTLLKEAQEMDQRRRHWSPDDRTMPSMWDDAE